MAETKLRGVYVPIVTPFEEDGSVAVEALERLALRLLDDGVAGLVPLGTTGEAPLLDEEERRTVVEVCARACASKGAHLVPGAGSNSTRHSVAAVQALSDMPALSAVLCLVPYYVRPTQAGIAAHFEAVAAASPVPVVIYNIPVRTGCRAEADTLLNLAQVENIVGVKQSAPLDADTERLLAEAPDGFAVLCGEDAHLAAMTLRGGAGGITASAHLSTRRWVAMVDAALAGRVDEATDEQAELVPLVEACFAEPSPAVFKGLLHAAGEIPTASVRLPFLPAAEQSVRRAGAALETVR